MAASTSRTCRASSASSASASLSAQREKRFADTTSVARKTRNRRPCTTTRRHRHADLGGSGTANVATRSSLLGTGGREGGGEAEDEEEEDEEEGEICKGVG